MWRYINLLEKGVMNFFTRFIVLLMCCLTLSSCITTQALYENHRDSDRINGFLVSTDEKMLVATGDEFHYIFPLPKIVKAVAQWPGHTNIYPTVKDAWRSGSSMQATLVLSVAADKLSAQDRSFLESNGFTIEKFASSYTYQTQLDGSIYLAGEKPIPKTLMLSHPFTVSIERKDTGGSLAAKLVLTPVTIAIDGVLAIAAIPLIPVFAVAMGSVPMG